jgi:predicted amidohydrolase YtcJ
MTASTRVFSAARIITMNPSIPTATHVAVRQGRILGVGTADEMAAFGEAVLDARFAGKVILPGFVEGHAHAAEGLMWRNCYVGYFDRVAPDGTLWTGLKSIAEVVGRLREALAALPRDAPLLAWGFDPIYFDGARMSVADLDPLTADRMIVVSHASGHIMNVNSLVLWRAGFSRDDNIDGLVRDDAGALTGELLGPPVMSRASRVAGGGGLLRPLDARGLRDYAAAARRVGVTTATDLVNALTPELVDLLRAVTAEPGFPLRLVPALAAREYSPEAGVARLLELRPTSTDKLRFGIVKLVVDGSIQGFTARLRWPFYHNGAPNGLWYVAPAELGAIMLAYHRAGLQMHIHTNGDEASDLATEMIGRAVEAHPRPDHRHTLQHCQMADAAIFRRMAAQGMCVNLFANHLYYWGEQHAALTMGPSRARRLDACATALRERVPLAIHSDAPVTPLGPLFTAWCAVNRLTAQGRVLGPDERINVAEALHAVTLGAAYTLKLDHLVGSIDVGKFADFAVLDDDPFAVAPAALRDIPVHATMVGGEVA